MDYSQSQILTSDQFVDNMQRITRSKEIIARKKAEKIEARKVAKWKRVEEKEVEKLAKERDMIKKEFFLRRNKTKHLEVLMQKVREDVRIFGLMKC